tara:strand:- start:594 stop:1025 length:432 start_codon:yes stop_codon:yes gene_type:complete
MILISHRGNINGIDKRNENKIDYIKNAIHEGFNVEIDIRCFNDKLYLGHDEPDVKIDNEFLINDKLWCHAKDIDALYKLRKLNSIHFWHQNDDYTLTSNGYFWTFPGKKLNFRSICVLPELAKYKNINCSGICSDYIEKYKIV